MKYYQVDVSAEPKVIGVKNGVFQFKIDYEKIYEDERFQSFLSFFDYNNKNFWKNQDTIKKFEISRIPAEMIKKAKVTDIMGYTPIITFLNEAFSSKYFNILKEYDVNILGAFEVQIENVTEKYYLLFNKTINMDKIFYKESILITGHAFMNNLKYHYVNNEFEYIEFKQKNPLGKFEMISIPKEYFGKDIISIQPLANPFYSEKLIDGLLNKGITGLEIKYENSIKLNFI